MLPLYMLLCQFIYLNQLQVLGHDISISISDNGINHIASVAEEIFDIESKILNFSIEHNSTIQGSLSIFHDDIYFQNFSYSHISITFSQSQLMHIKISNVSLHIPSFDIETKYEFIPSIYSICSGYVSAEFSGWDFEISLSFKQSNNFCRLPLVVNQSSIVIFMYNDKLKINYSLKPKTCSLFVPIIDIYLKKITLSTLPTFLGHKFRKILLHKLLPYTQTIRYDSKDLAIFCYDSAYIQMEQNINETFYELHINIDLIVNKSDKRWNYTKGHNGDVNIVYNGPIDMYHKGFIKGIEKRKKQLMNIVIIIVLCISCVIVFLFVLCKWNKCMKQRVNYKLVEMGISTKHERKYGSIHSIEEKEINNKQPNSHSFLHETF